MTETPQPQGTAPHEGFDRDGLRDFERLRRSRTDRKIAGVAGGLGRHLNIDPTILRVLFVVLVFFGGAGLLLYGVAWLIVPEEGSDEATVSTSPSTRNAVLVVVGILAALLLIGDSWGGFGFPWPLAIIALVVVLFIVNKDRGRPSSSATPPPGTPGTTGAPPASDTSDTQAGPAAPFVGQSQQGWVGDSGTASYAAPAYSSSTGYEPPSGPPSDPTWYGGYQSHPAPRPSKKDRGPKLFGVTLALVAIAIGVLSLVDVLGASVADAAYPALALTVIGAMLVVGSVFGRPGGLIFLGLVATFALLVASAGDEYGWNEPARVYTPQTAAIALQTDYDFPAGAITVDLTEVSDLERLDNENLDISAGFGEVRVIVPDGLDVDVNAQIDRGGEIVVDGQRDDEWSPSVITTIDGGDDVPIMNLDIDLNFGSIDVRQEAAA